VLFGFIYVPTAVFGDSEEFVTEPIVLVGAGYVSISEGQLDFAIFSSGSVLRNQGERIEIIEAGRVTEVHPSVRRLSVGRTNFLSEDEKSSLARRFEAFFAKAKAAQADDLISRKTLRGVAKFILSVDLPYKERFKARLGNELGLHGIDLGVTRSAGRKSLEKRDF